MKWSLVTKSPNPSLEGDYTRSGVKDHIRIEASNQCVYCAIHENYIGGIRAFHIEHYRPKGLPAFKHLEHVLDNLYYACPICNGFKKSTWPNEPLDDFSVASYPNPAIIDYNSLFSVKADGQVGGLYVASTYMAEQLYLNRPQLILYRRQELADEKMESISANKQNVFNSLIEATDKSSKEYLKEINRLEMEIHAHLIKGKTIPFYETQDVTRP